MPNLDPREGVQNLEWKPEWKPKEKSEKHVGQITVAISDINQNLDDLEHGLESLEETLAPILTSENRHEEEKRPHLEVGQAEVPLAESLHRIAYRIHQYALKLQEIRNRNEL